MEDLEGSLSAADLVVSSTGATRTVIGTDMVRRARPHRRPLFVLDLAVPRDVEPGVGDLPGIALADIDDLREVVARGRGEMARDVDAARRIVAEETRRYAVARRAARLAPVIEALHERGERIRGEEVRRLASRLAALPARDREAVEALTRRIVRRLLHDPVVTLKDLAGKGSAEPAARTLTELFGLDLDEG
jgi:glutamyl-tRNA reductase